MINRKNTYDTLSQVLSHMDEPQLLQLISSGRVVHEGIGGSSVQVDLQGVPIFVRSFVPDLTGGLFT